MHYNYHRNYWPYAGQYVQHDPIGLAGGTNPYLYANANPLRSTDPFGLWSTEAHNELIRGFGARYGLTDVQQRAMMRKMLRVVEALVLGREVRKPGDLRLLVHRDQQRVAGARQQQAHVEREDALVAAWARAWLVGGPLICGMDGMARCG